MYGGSPVIYQATFLLQNEGWCAKGRFQQTRLVIDLGVPVRVPNEMKGAEEKP